MTAKIMLGAVVAGLMVLDWITWNRLKRYLIYSGESRYRRGRDLGWMRSDLYRPDGLPLLNRLRSIFLAEIVTWLLFVVLLTQ